MTVIEQILPDYEADVAVRTVASRVWRQYKDHTEFDDLVQEAWVWWYGKGQRHLPEYLTDENLGRLSVTLYRIMRRYAEAQKAESVGYQPRDQYNYRPGEIVDLIPIALDPNGLPSPGYPDEGQGPAPKGNLAEGGDVLAALVDVRRALTALPEEDMHFLQMADDCAYDWDRFTARYGGDTLPDSHRRQHAKIAERMARWLSNNTEEF